MGAPSTGTARFAWRLLGLCLAVAAQAAPARELAPRDHGLGPVIDEVVLSVGERFVTRSELELEARVVLLMGGGAQGAFASIPGDTVASVLDYVVNQLLILKEVDRLRVFEVDTEEVGSEYARFVAAFEDPTALDDFLHALDVGPKRIAAILRRNLRVQRYLESRVRLTVRVAEDEVVAFFVENSERFADRSLEEMREAIRGYLFRERFEAAVQELMDDLRARTEIRVLAEPRPFPGLARSRRSFDGGE